MSFSSDNPLITNQLPISFEFPPDQKDIRETISLIYKRIANSVNSREGGLYTVQETFCSQQFFTPGNPQRFRNVYRKVIDFGALPAAAGTTSIPHEIGGDAVTPIPNTYIFTRIYAVARSAIGTVWIPIPYVIPGTTDNVNIYVDALNVNIQVSTANYSSYTQCYVILEYIKE
jgi:hypothetical protein